MCTQTQAEVMGTEREWEWLMDGDGLMGTGFYWGMTECSGTLYRWYSYDVNILSSKRYCFELMSCEFHSRE